MENATIPKKPIKPCIIRRRLAREKAREQRIISLQSNDGVTGIVQPSNKHPVRIVKADALLRSLYGENTPDMPAHSGPVSGENAIIRSYPGYFTFITVFLIFALCFMIFDKRPSVDRAFSSIKEDYYTIQKMMVRRLHEVFVENKKQEIRRRVEALNFKKNRVQAMLQDLVDEINKEIVN